MRLTPPDETYTPLTLETLAALPLPVPAARIHYGSGPQQFGELRLPEGSEPHPVVLIIHGGCWRNRHSLDYITRLSAWITTELALATWTIEYRRLGDSGGGWPGTFQDVAAGADFIAELARVHPLDHTRVLAAGHSAGGQLALWLATRNRLAAAGELHCATPLAVGGVLGLAAITDLDTYRFGPPDSCNAAVEVLLGGPPETCAERYADTSPMRRLPVKVPCAFIQGSLDPTVPDTSVHTFINHAQRAGDDCRLWTLPECGHFEPSIPHPKSEQALRSAIAWLMGAERS